VGLESVEMLVNLFGALFAGALIGLERGHHGRPAGFRTHCLVCLASSLLMMVSYYQQSWVPDEALATVQMDPTRMAQGIMTGIGFLGAGVIFKEGLSVRGLTTAASIWITAAIGILIGVGLYFAAAVSVALTLGVLSVFRVIETKIPHYSYVHHHLRFRRSEVIPEDDLVAQLKDHGFSISSITYRIDDENLFEYRMILRTRQLANTSKLADYWSKHGSVRGFRISPTA
jgi:putative Mg2+ transporter-C (MgtC) family protein